MAYQTFAIDFTLIDQIFYKTITIEHTKQPRKSAS